VLPKSAETAPPIALGITSVVLATISLLLSFLPVLSLPIAACGLILSLAGAFSARWRPQESLRWALVGGCGTLAALGIGLAIQFAPLGETPRAEVPPLWQRPPNTLFVPPPAPPG
jgi:hypothetical protein